MKAVQKFSRKQQATANIDAVEHTTLPEIATSERPNVTIVKNLDT